MVLELILHISLSIGE